MTVEIMVARWMDFTKAVALGDAFLCWWRIQMRTLITTLVFLMLGSAAMAQNTGTGYA